MYSQQRILGFWLWRVAALLVASPLSAGETALAHPHLAGFDRFVQRTLDSYEVPGAVVVIVDDDEVKLLKGYGVRRAGKRRPINKDTRFQIGSLTKLVTATALGVLVDEEKLNWDRPLKDYLPTFAMNDAYASLHATLRDMLAHRSGLMAYNGDLFNRLSYDREEILQRVKYLVPGSSFRAQWAYSNLGIFIAGEAAAEADRSTWEDVVATRILSPLGMTRSGPNAKDQFEDDNYASAHNIDGSVMDTENVDKLGASGSVISTGADLARWMRMLLAEGAFGAKRILRAKTVHEIFAASMVEGPHGLLADQNAVAGLGCDSYRFLRFLVVEKNGAQNGFRSIVTLVPEKRIGIAIIANKQLTALPEAVRAEFLERHLGESGKDLQSEIREQQAAWNSLVMLPEPPENAEPATKPLEEFAGIYVSPAYGSLHLSLAGNELEGRFASGNYPVRLEHWSGNTFLLVFPDPDDQLGLVTFVVDSVGAVTGLRGESYNLGFGTNYGEFIRRIDSAVPLK